VLRYARKLFQGKYVNRITAASRLSKAAKAGLLAAFMCMSAQGSFAQATPPAAPTVLADGAGAKFGRFDNMHKTRFIEIFLAYRDAKSGDFLAECYNSMFTAKGIPATKDTAPQAQVEGLDFARMRLCPSSCAKRRSQPRSDLESCGKPHKLLLLLFEQVHVQVTVILQPALVKPVRPLSAAIGLGLPDCDRVRARGGAFRIRRIEDLRGL
jgi:hypothetical protein